MFVNFLFFNIILCTCVFAQPCGSSCFFFSLSFNHLTRINDNMNNALNPCFALCGLLKSLPIGFASIWATYFGSKFNRVAGQACFSSPVAKLCRLHFCGSLCLWIWLMEGQCCYHEQFFYGKRDTARMYHEAQIRIGSSGLENSWRF